MISPMTKYSFILLNGEQEGLLEKLQEIGLSSGRTSSSPSARFSSRKSSRPPLSRVT